MITPAELWRNKREQVVVFSSTAIALYGYDQGMMSLINTNYSYLDTMGISSTDVLVGLIVSVYYLGCTVGAVIASGTADQFGRRLSIFACLATASLGNLLMFVSGLGVMPKGKASLICMFVGRIVMGLGIGGIDAVVPVYSSELSEDGQRGRSLAQEFQANILGLNLAFAVNLLVTNYLGKSSQVSPATLPQASIANSGLMCQLTVGLAHPDHRHANLSTHPHGHHRTSSRVPALPHNAWSRRRGQ